MTVGPFPTTRLRRNRTDSWTRRLVAETRLSVDDLIWPVFLRPGSGEVEEVASMPGAERVTLDRLAAHLETAAQLRIPMVALFPATSAELKDADGTEAANPDNLICQSEPSLAETLSTRRAPDPHGRNLDRRTPPLPRPRRSAR